MSAGRLWRTVRHLSAGQVAWRVLCRGRRTLMRRFPGVARARAERAAAALPIPDPSRPALAAIADDVLALQRTIHGATFARARHGGFRLLNRDFDFGAIEDIDWRGDFHEGNNPLRRMVLAYMGYAVPLLADGHADAPGVVVGLIRSLEARNPWSAPGALGDVWHPYAASHRAINLIAGLALYRRAGGPPAPEAETVILRHARLCAAVVRGNLERDIRFNHLLKNLTALAVFAAACDAPPVGWDFLERAVPQSVAECVLADGGHAERSPMYHALGLLDLRVLAASGLYPESWQPLLGDTVAAMDRALAAQSLGDGDIALFNDSWLGEAPPAAALTAGHAGAVARLPVTGYVRLGDGMHDLVFDCGPCGPDENPGHAHADFLSVEATVGGARFLVDTGVPTYTAGAARDASRSAAAHNGPRLADAEPVEFWKSFRVGRRGTGALLDPSAFDGIAPLHAAGRQTGYAHLGVEVRRFVGLWPDRGMLVADLWLARRGGRVREPATRFLIPGDWEISADGAFRQGGAEIAVAALAGTLDVPGEASWWRRFDVEETAHRLDLAPETDGAGARAAVWFSWPATEGGAGSDRNGTGTPPDDDAIADLFARLSAARIAVA